MSPALPRTVLPAVLVASLLVTAGCVAGPSASADAGPTTYTVPTNATEGPVDTVDPSGHAGTPVGTASLPYDLSLSNRRNASVEMTLAVFDTGTGERVFYEEAALDAHETVHYDLPIDQGTYAVRTRVGDSAQTHRWTVESTPPSTALVVAAQPGGDVGFVESAA